MCLIGFKEDTSIRAFIGSNLINFKVTTITETIINFDFNKPIVRVTAEECCCAHLGFNFQEMLEKSVKENLR